MQKDTFEQTELRDADLIVDAYYKGGRNANMRDDPLGPLVGVGNQGGFRHLGKRQFPHLIVITTSMSEPDWPDHLDSETGTLTYFGDNRLPGRELHDTPRWGNRMLSDLFSAAHGSDTDRQKVPPVLVFRSTGVYRDVRFLGLAVPGGLGIPSTQDIVATWHHVSGHRFQNYKAIFTILDAPSVSRDWIVDIQRGNLLTSNAPDAWTSWRMTGGYSPLRSIPVRTYRTKDEQLPLNSEDAAMVSEIYGFFESNPYGFEMCAAQISEMLLPGIVSIDVTRPFRDGGRDAVGQYRIGFNNSAVNVEFAMEAKCYSHKNSVGIKETSRLISRLRYRQFGILVTTSFVNNQAYKEIVEDEHPVLIVCGADIVSILKRAGIRDSSAIHEWLSSSFDKNTN